MGQLIIKCLVIVLIALSLHIGAFILETQYEPVGYFASFVDKKALLENHPAGTVIIMGGSHGAFSFDSEILASDLERPVINTALHAGMDLRFMLDSVLPYLREGDHILLPLEHEYYLNHPNINDSDMLRRLLSIDFQHTVTTISTWKQWQTVMEYHSEQSFLAFWRTTVENNTACEGLYCRSSFTPLGDVSDDFLQPDTLSRANLAQRIANETIYDRDTDFNDDAIELLNQFAEDVRDKGAFVYIILPPVPESLADRADLDAYAEQITTEIDIPLLNMPYSFPDAYYFDTKYHLNAEGKAENTRFLLPLIQDAIANTVTSP